MKKSIIFLMSFVLMLLVCLVGCSPKKASDESHIGTSKNDVVSSEESQKDTKDSVVVEEETVENSDVSIEKLKDITGLPQRIETNLEDNYGNTYERALQVNHRHKYLLDGKYSHFSAVYFTNQTGTHSCSYKIRIYADDTLLYEERIDPESKPINIDLDIQGCNVFEIREDEDLYAFGSSYLHNAIFKQE